MAQPYVGEIRMFAGNFAPAGWMFCEGQLLPISENETLFQLIGTTYGGDGEATFALPDLRGRLPIHQGQGPGTSNRQLAETGGSEEVTLTVQQLPIHTHPLLVNAGAGAANSPTNHVLASSPSIDLYRESSPSVQLAPTSVGPVGGSQPHSNFQPYLCIDFIISLFGIFPSPT
jgi:microcystin-dependent protein